MSRANLENISFTNLLPVFPDTLPESLLAREPVVESGDAAFMADNAAGDALDPVPGVETLASKVAALQAARGGNEDVGC